MAGDGRSFEQQYTISEDGYGVDYNVRFNGLGNVLKPENNTISLNWLNHLDRLELNYTYEQMYSSVYFKESDEDYDYCSCTSDDLEDLNSEPIEWMAHSNQFFATVLMAKGKPFTGGEFETRVIDREKLKDSPDLKVLNSKLQIPTDQETFAMHMYLGPKRL